MDERYGPPGPGDRFPNGDFHGRHPGDHHMDRGGRGFNHMDRGRGFNGRGGRGFDGPGGPMDHPGRGGFDMRMRGGPPDMRGGRGGFDMRGRGRGFHHYGRWRQNSFGEDDDYEMAQGDRDEFSNLMTQKEKDWIIKIQLMQIHTNDPYLDDYYFTVNNCTYDIILTYCNSGNIWKNVWIFRKTGNFVSFFAKKVQHFIK